MTCSRTLGTAAASLLLAVGVAGSATAVPAAPTPAGDVALVAMSKSQAARVFQNGLCPADQAIDVVIQAQEDNASWEALQPLIRAMARDQLRVSRVLDSPPRPWPASVRAHIPAIGVLQNVQSGMNYELAGAGSTEEYQALIDGLEPLAPGLTRMGEAYWDAMETITRRLDLPAGNACGGYT